MSVIKSGIILISINSLAHEGITYTLKDKRSAWVFKVLFSDNTQTFHFPFYEELFSEKILEKRQPTMTLTSICFRKLISLFSQTDRGHTDYRTHYESRPRLTPGRAIEINGTKSGTTTERFWHRNLKWNKFDMLSVDYEPNINLILT